MYTQNVFVSQLIYHHGTLTPDEGCCCGGVVGQFGFAIDLSFVSSEISTTKSGNELFFVFVCVSCSNMGFN